MNNASPAYLVLNRFDDEFGEYHRFVDATRCRLVYLTTVNGLAILDREHAFDTVVLPDLDFDTVLPAARQLAACAGGFTGIVGLSEYDLLAAARLREVFGIPGYRPEFVLRFKDKAVMKRAVAAAGLRVPRFRDLSGGGTVSDVVAELGLPVILKPRIGAASHGVIRADDATTLERALAAIDTDYECEEFVEGDILHVDGVRRDGDFHFVSASVYVNSCFDFACGLRLGSVLLDPGSRRDRIVAFAGACLDALGLADGPFHLELFETPRDELVFLEVGLRPGGGEIPFIHRDLFGIDLLGEAFRVSLGMPPLTPISAFTEPEGGGFVMVPEPPPYPSRVVRRTSMIGAVPEVYREISPDVGEVFDGKGGYEHIGGRFHLRGPGEAAVRHAVHEVIRRYNLVAEPVDDAMLIEKAHR